MPPRLSPDSLWADPDWRRYWTSRIVSYAGGTVTYSLSGADAGSFSINSSTGVVTINAIPDYEAKPSYSINVVASDGTLSSTQAVTVSVADVAPTISSGAAGSVTEGASAGTTVYTASASDPAPPGQALTGDHNLVNAQAEIDYIVREDEIDSFVMLSDRADALVEMPDKAGEAVAVYAALAKDHPADPLAPQALYMAAFASLRQKQFAAMLRAGHGQDAARTLIAALSVEAAEAWAAEEGMDL